MTTFSTNICSPSFKLRIRAAVSFFLLLFGSQKILFASSSLLPEGFDFQQNPPQHQYFRVKPVDTEVVEGDVAELQCQIGAQAGPVQWSKDGFLLGFQASIPGYPRYAMIIDTEKAWYNLRIHNVQLDDEGEYQCQVGPAPSQQPIRASSRLTVIVPSKSLTIGGSKPDTSQSPSFSTSTSSSSSSSSSKKGNVYIAEVKEGEKIVLICFASASKPPPRMKWYRKNTELLPEASRTYYNKSIINNKYVLFSTESSIILYPKSEEQYSCELQHPGLTKPLRASALINILNPPDPPIIEGFKEGDVVTASESLTLTCITKRGYPPPKVIWYRNGIEVDRSFVVTSRNDVINTHMFVVTVDDNQSVYKCSASNSLTPKPLEAAVRLNVVFLPSKVTITGPTEAKLFQTVAIKCTTRPSNPPPRISWYVDGNVSSSGTIETRSDGGNAWIVISTLTLTIMSKDPNVKTFMCQAESSVLRDTVYATHRVAIIYPPSFPTLIGYQEGETLQAGVLKKVKCTTLGGNPPANLKFFRKDREISGIASVTGSGVSSELVIRPEPGDNGVTYRCQANSAALSEPYQVPFTLVVHYPPEKVKISVEPLPVKAGQMVKVECVTSPSNPSSIIEWRRNGKNVIDFETDREKNKGEDGIENGEITRSWFRFNATPEDDGSVLTCLARNPLIEGSLSRDDFGLTVLFKPFFEFSETNLALGEGENKVVNISFWANPRVEKFDWKKLSGRGSAGIQDEDTEPIPYNSMRSNGSLLYIWNISRNDSGKYLAVAKNALGESAAYLNIDVHYSAVIRDPVNVITSSGRRGLLPQEGDAHIELHCRIDSNPSSKVQWRKEDKEQNIDWFRAKLREEKYPRHQISILTIFNISRADAGIYTCSAFNGIGVGIAQKRVTINVEYKPLIVENASKVASEPGTQEVKLSCVAKGFPNVYFNWSLDEVDRSRYKIMNSDNYVSPDGSFDLFRSDLIISQLKESDFRTYRCLAYNHLGSDKMDLDLVRKSIPDSPKDLRALNKSHNSVLLEWKPGFDGGLEQSFRIRYRRVTQEDTGDNHLEYHYVYASPGSNRALIQDLEPESEYHFTVSSRNKLGESLMSREFLKVKTLSAASEATRTNSVYASADEHRLGQSGIMSESTTFVVASATASLLLFACLSAFAVIYYQKRKQTETTAKKDAIVDATEDQSPFLISSNMTICNCESALQPHILITEQTESEDHSFPQNKCLYIEAYKDCQSKLISEVGSAQQPDILMNQIKEDGVNHSICCEGNFEAKIESVEGYGDENSDIGLTFVQRLPRVSIVGPEYVSGHSPLSTVEEEAEEMV